MWAELVASSPLGSGGQTGHARQHVGPGPLHLWFPGPAACCQDGGRAREVGVSRENRKAKSQVAISVLASEIEKYTRLGPSESQEPAPIPSSRLPPPSSSSGLCCHGVPMRPGEFMACPLNSPVHPLPACWVQKALFALQLVPASRSITVLQGTEMSFSVSPAWRCPQV